MEQIQDQLDQLSEGWEEVYKTLQLNPQVAATHLNNITLEQLNEVVDTTKNIMSQVRAPKGFKPGFHVAKSVAATSLSTANNSLANLRQGQYGHLPAFIIGLNQVNTALYSCLLKSETMDPNGNLGSELAENIALIKTAQQELSKKLDVLKSVEVIAQTISHFHEEFQKIPASASLLLDEIKAKAESASLMNEQIQTLEMTQKKLAADSAETLKSLQKYEVTISKQAADLKTITDNAEKQENIINALLPRAASAGLASAFSERVKAMNISKWIWGLTFFASIIALIVVGSHVIGETSSPTASNFSILGVIIRRFPILGPLIWLGWFSAVQYGNSLRVQEDYAFKEATSKAFAGYRDHMEHLKSVGDEEANSALGLLSVKTIQILSQEPLRVFRGTHGDAIPAQGVRDLLLPKTQNTTSKNT